MFFFDVKYWRMEANEWTSGKANNEAQIRG